MPHLNPRPFASTKNLNKQLKKNLLANKTPRFPASPSNTARKPTAQRKTLPPAISMRPHMPAQAKPKSSMHIFSSSPRTKYHTSINRSQSFNHSYCLLQICRMLILDSLSMHDKVPQIRRFLPETPLHSPLKSDREISKKSPQFQGPRLPKHQYTHHTSPRYKTKPQLPQYYLTGIRHRKPRNLQVSSLATQGAKDSLRTGHTRQPNSEVKADGQRCSEPSPLHKKANR